MRRPLQMRPLTEEEVRVIHKLVRSQTASVRLVERAKIIDYRPQHVSCIQATQSVACAVCSVSPRAVTFAWRRREPSARANANEEEQARII